MKYLCLIYYPESTLDAFSPSEYTAIMEENHGIFEEIRGKVIDTNRLESVRTATTVRVREGKLSTTDGPFAETKEQLGGYFFSKRRT